MYAVMSSSLPEFDDTTEDELCEVLLSGLTLKQLEVVTKKSARAFICEKFGLTKKYVKRSGKDDMIANAAVRAFEKLSAATVPTKRKKRRRAEMESDVENMDDENITNDSGDNSETADVSDADFEPKKKKRRSKHKSKSGSKSKKRRSKKKKKSSGDDSDNDATAVDGEDEKEEGSEESEERPKKRRTAKRKAKVGSGVNADEPGAVRLTKLRKLLRCVGMANPRMYAKLKPMSNKEQIKHLEKVFGDADIACRSCDLTEAKLKKTKAQFETKKELEELTASSFFKGSEELPSKRRRKRVNYASLYGSAQVDADDSDDDSADASGKPAVGGPKEDGFKEADSSEEPESDENDDDAYVPSEGDSESDNDVDEERDSNGSEADE